MDTISKLKITKGNKDMKTVGGLMDFQPVWETAVHLAVAGGVFDGVFCAVLFPTRCLG